MNLLRTHLVGMQPCSQSSGFKFLFLFLECNRSHVRTIASQMFLFYFWSAIVRTYERLQVKFLFLFQECNRSYVRTIASQILFHFWSAIVRTYERLQAKCFYFISGVQSFVHTNDCKSKFYFYFRSAIVRTYERLQVKILFHFWSAIVRTYERLQAKFFYFISGLQSFVRMNDCKPNFFISFLDCN